MAKFYINFRHGEQVAQDREDTELPDLSCAERTGNNICTRVIGRKDQVGLQDTGGSPNHHPKVGGSL
jgi:hypothetical protein